MPTPTVIDKYRWSDVINRRYWDRYFFDSMSVNPACVPVGGGGGASGVSSQAVISNKTDQSVAVVTTAGTGTVTFDTNTVLGANFTHTVGTDGLAVLSAGVYQFMFDVSGAESNQFQIYVNNAAIPGTTFGSGAGTQQNTGFGYLTLLANDVVTVVNSSSDAAVTLAGSTPIGGTNVDNANATLSLTKVPAVSSNAGSLGQVSVMITSKNDFEYYNIVANNNIGPSLDGSFGLNLAADAISGHGVEYDTGITPQNNYKFVINTNPFAPPLNPGNGPNPPPRAFFVKAQFKVATVGGVNPLIVGFRVLAARSQTLNYASFASIGISGTAGHIQTLTNLSSAGVITTDTTELAVDATMFEIAVFVDIFGKVTYEVNGQPATVVVPYQFPNGAIVIPFIRVVQSSTTTATASCNYFECGYQS